MQFSPSFLLFSPLLGPNIFLNTPFLYILLTVRDQSLHPQGNNQLLMEATVNLWSRRGEREREKRESEASSDMNYFLTGGGGEKNLDLRLRRSPGSARSSFW
jgi:hypothetical protein